MTAAQAMLFFPFGLVIGVWVAWTDLSRMKIPNTAVLSLLAVWVVLGPLVLEWQVWGWGMAVAFLVMLAGMMGMVLRLFGGGDAKFVAAMTPYFVQEPLRDTLFLSFVVIVAALILHRLWRVIPALRNLTPNWASWTRREFPLGFALAGILIFHLALTAFTPVLANI
jgi:prepilin peptidase CpaA